MGAVVIAAWLLEAKQSAIENVAPVLTLLCTPLFTLLLLAFLATMAWTGSGIAVEREVLIGFVRGGALTRRGQGGRAILSLPARP